MTNLTLSCKGSRNIALPRVAAGHGLISNIVSKYGKGKGKAIPLQAWTGPEGSRRLSLPDFKTLGTLRW
jgi:hypothetical protein